MAYDNEVLKRAVKAAYAKGRKMGVPQGFTGQAPAQPKPPTDLEKALASAPTYPGAYGAVLEYVNPDKIRQAAHEYFTYMLMIGADRDLLEKDPYWKYMEE